MFIGPCIAKKQEAEQHPELLDAVLTFEELDNWLGEEDIDLRMVIETEDGPISRWRTRARDRSYPIEGGMTPGITRSGEVNSSQVMSFSGIANVEQALKGIAEWRPEHNIFLELTACAGSCVNGPKAARNRSIAKRQVRGSAVRQAGRLHAPRRRTWRERGPTRQVRSAQRVQRDADYRGVAQRGQVLGRR